MAGLYVVDIREPIDDKTYRHFLSCISEEQREQLRRFRFENDLWRTLYGDILTRHLFCRQTGLAGERFVPQKNEQGKPYLPQSPDFCYNVSHSGQYVVCAVDDRPVGVDVERQGRERPRVAARFFTPYEQEALSRLTEESQRIARFYQLWTLKESYLKFTGQGFSLSCASFGFRFEGERCTPVGTQAGAFFHRYFCLPGYALALCCQNERAANMQRLSLAQIARSPL